MLSRVARRLNSRSGEHDAMQARLADLEHRLEDERAARNDLHADLRRSIDDLGRRINALATRLDETQ